jgi:hypothetical protein
MRCDRPEDHGRQATHERDARAVGCGRCDTGCLPSWSTAVAAAAVATHVVALLGVFVTVWPCVTTLLSRPGRQGMVQCEDQRLQGAAGVRPSTARF